VSAPLEVRSFRSVFALERRIYRIDTLRLNPGGVPLRGIVYAAALMVVALVAGSVPPTAWADAVIPWFVRDIGLPILAATLLGAARIEGRPFHTAALSLLALAGGRRRFVALAPGGSRSRRWSPPALLCVPDGSDARFRSLRYRGPGAVLVNRPHLRAEWSRPRRVDVTLHPAAGTLERAVVLDLAAGTVLEVRAR
jgi:hypothetical protein